MDFIIAATSIQPDRSFVFTLTVIIAGLGIVLATLALLIVIFNLFGTAVYAMQRKAEQKKLKSTVPEQATLQGQKNEVPLPPPIVESEGVSPQIVAAIAAAVYSMEGEDAKITSITRKTVPSSDFSIWAQAAVTDNTKPF